MMVLLFTKLQLLRAIGSGSHAVVGTKYPAVRRKFHCCYEQFHSRI
jgi:hypothetical protein